ncbi:MAG: hypothetical protein QOF63_343 [Thermoanaerobaculia bacterium]|jgi:hypothetical protein|nr:hypothetical protein [Thermoanaerobaculia bacterium]
MSLRTHSVPKRTMHISNPSGRERLVECILIVPPLAGASKTRNAIFLAHRPPHARIGRDGLTDGWTKSVVQSNCQIFPAVERDEIAFE